MMWKRILRIREGEEVKTKEEEVFELITMGMNKDEKAILRAFMQGRRELNKKEYMKFEGKLREYTKAMEQPDKYLNEFLKNPEDFFIHGESGLAAAPRRMFYWELQREQ